MRLIALIILTLLLAEIAQAEFTIAGPFAARDGETCVVCYSKLSRDDLAYTIDGQRVAVMRGMEGQLLANPGAYVKKSAPRPPAESRAPYLWPGLVALAGIAAAAVVIAKRRR